MINTPKVYKPTLSMRFPHGLSDKPLNEGRIGLAFDLLIGLFRKNFRIFMHYYWIASLRLQKLGMHWIVFASLKTKQ